MVREWRHLHGLKRAGCGHEGKELSTLEEGRLAMLCPCCPHPGINLPDGWEKEAPEKG
jgi:hypothetical protein